MEPSILDKSLGKTLRTTNSHLNRLLELGIQTVRDFFLYFPRAYTDAREIRKISQLIPGEVNTTQGQIKSIFGRRTRLGKFFIRAKLFDGSSELEIVWFNQPHLLRMLKAGEWIMVSGKLNAGESKFIMVSPRLEPIKDEQIHVARIVPVYPETELLVGQKKRNAAQAPRGKISSKWIREKLFPLLPFAEYFEEFLPMDILKAEHLIPYQEAIRKIHFPENEEDIEHASARLAFNELFLLQLSALKQKYEWQRISIEEKKQITFDLALIKKFIQKLPFELTLAQKKTLKEILDDLAKPYPMSRLLQGDVGSGKTVVAAIAAFHVVKAGFQVCLMAPTEILAKQHFQTFVKLLQPEGFNIQCITGGIPQKQKEEIISQMKTGRCDIVIGTHALIQDKIGFANLGLAVIDEQHRFGVKQREKVKSFGKPHLLSLSATPIPRTLALTIYGDQDLSIIDEMPKGRQAIITRVVPEKKRVDAYRWVEDQVRKGKQVYIICPLIDAPENSETRVEELGEGESNLSVKAATEEYERLKETVFKELKIGLLHGKMKQKEKNLVYEAFSKNEIQILVSTSVVEVGIDVSNATIIIIEGAERFGLAQLHQFRGRVGRGTHQSYCFLFPSGSKQSAQGQDTAHQETSERLKAVCQYSSGFKLAELDLRLRGPGEMYGIRQSGLPDLKMASLTDSITIQKTRMWAEMIIRNDPEFKTLPKLAVKVRELEITKNIAVDY